jgi:hypothetical protein
MWGLEGTGEARLGASPVVGSMGPGGCVGGGFRKGLATSAYFSRARPQHDLRLRGKRRGRDARETDQHFLTRTYPPRNRAGAATVAQYENLLRFFIPPPGSEAGSTERNIRGPGCHRAPVPHLQRVKLRWRVRRNGPKKGRDPEGPRLGWYFLWPTRRAALGWVDPEGSRHLTRRLAPDRQAALGVPCRLLRDPCLGGQVPLGHPALFAGSSLARVTAPRTRSLFLSMVESSGRSVRPVGRVRWP